jgi:hypothetical protein
LTFSEDFQNLQRYLEYCMLLLTFFLWPIRWTEAIINRLSRYLILHKAWSILSQCYSKLLEWLELLESLEFSESIMDNPWNLDSSHISETTATRRYRVVMKGAEWQNMKQRLLRFMQSHVEQCDQEKDYPFYRGLFREETPVI